MRIAAIGGSASIGSTANGVHGASGAGGICAIGSICKSACAICECIATCSTNAACASSHPSGGPSSHEDTWRSMRWTWTFSVAPNCFENAGRAMSAASSGSIIPTPCNWSARFTFSDHGSIVPVPVMMLTVFTRAKSLPLNHSCLDAPSTPTMRSNWGTEKYFIAIWSLMRPCRAHAVCSAWFMRVSVLVASATSMRSATPDLTLASEARSGGRNPAAESIWSYCQPIMFQNAPGKSRGCSRTGTSSFVRTCA